LADYHDCDRYRRIKGWRLYIMQLYK
jgi:hypothetical protein